MIKKNATEESLPYVPIDLDALFADIFTRIAAAKEFDPVPGELDRFFTDRTWRLLEDTLRDSTIQYIKELLDPQITREKHIELCTMIKALRWVANARVNLFHAEKQRRPQAQGEIPHAAR